MGYSLKPRHKAAGDLDLGAFSWPWMLEADVGLPIGYWKGFMPGQYLCLKRPDGLNVSYNDGARVSAKEAKQMAAIADWVADYQDSLYTEWNAMPEAERKRMSESTTFLYTTPVRRDFVEKTRAFAEWAPKSGGFRVY